MSIHIDHKGKYFTDVISKQSVKSVIQTLTVQIRGDLHVRPQHRFKDEVNKSERFIAVTDAVVYNARGEEIYRTGFLVLNLDQVVWISPEGEHSLNDKQ